MKFAIQYINDAEGNLQAVQLPLNEWKKLLTKLNKYEQTLKMKSDLKEAFDEVAMLKNKKGKKRTLNNFLNEI